MTDQPRDDVDTGSSTEVDVATPDDIEHAEAAGEHSSRRSRRRPDWGLLIASLAIAGGLILIGWGLLTAVTGDEGVDRPDAIENLTPVEDAIQVLQQESVIVDLEFGWEGRLRIDGIDIPTTTIGEIEVEPGEQLDLPPTAIFDPGNAVISFRPTDGAVIESWSAGPHQVELVYWRIEDGVETARTYVWSFNAV
ncbi:MAG: hypothetical protein ACR2O6_08410 [Ilumatobacteraceae bacterium]